MRQNARITDDTELTLLQLFNLLKIKGLLPSDITITDIIDNKYDDYKLLTLDNDHHFSIRGKKFYVKSPLNTFLFHGFTPNGELTDL